MWKSERRAGRPGFLGSRSGWAGGSLSGYARPGGMRMCAANTVVLSKNELARRTGEKDQGSRATGSPRPDWMEARSWAR
jgi:hypothetical protein